MASRPGPSAREGGGNLGIRYPHGHAASRLLSRGSSRTSPSARRCGPRDSWRRPDARRARSLPLAGGNSRMAESTCRHGDRGSSCSWRGRPGHDRTAPRGKPRSPSGAAADGGAIRDGSWCSPRARPGERPDRARPRGKRCKRDGPSLHARSHAERGTPCSRRPRGRICLDGRLGDRSCRRWHAHARWPVAHAGEDRGSPRTTRPTRAWGGPIAGSSDSARRPDPASSSRRAVRGSCCIAGARRCEGCRIARRRRGSSDKESLGRCRSRGGDGSPRTPRARPRTARWAAPWARGSSGRRRKRRAPPPRPRAAAGGMSYRPGSGSDATWRDWCECRRGNRRTARRAASRRRGADGSSSKVG